MTTCRVVRHKFTGKERDSETGLDYFGARYYGSNMGRFSSPDEPFMDQDTGDPQSWNIYAYVRNNPLNATDPTGLARNVCNKDSSRKEVCYWQGDYNGEYDKNQGLYWNAGTSEWQKNNPVPPKMDNGTVNPAFLGPFDVFFFRFPGGAAASTVEKAVGRATAETAVKTFGWGVTRVSAGALLKDGSKAAAKDVVEAMAEGAQKASLKRGLQAAGSQAKISLEVMGDGSVKMVITRPGFNGAQHIVKTVAADGSSRTVQAATDAAGNLVHYDPKH